VVTARPRRGQRLHPLDEIALIEDESNVVVQIIGSESVFPEFLEVECKDGEGRRIYLRDKEEDRHRYATRPNN
jgi:hypothetical protein